MRPLTRVVLSVLCFSASLVAAGPRRGPQVHSRTNRCVVPSQYQSSNGAADDSAAVSEAFQRCSKNAVVVFEQGIDYNVFQPVHATDLDNVEIQMKGNLHLPQNITAIQVLVNATHSGNLYWLMFAGPHIDYIGADDVTTGWINSYGQAWWDANPSGGTGSAARPHLMSFNTTHGSLRHFKSRKPIAWGVQLIGDDIVVEDTIVDAYSTGGFPFNTDGFDVTGTNIYITDSVIYNGDDAIAIQSGSKNVVFEHATIGYQSHGMSIGSLGQNQAEYATVSDIRFEDVTVIDSIYAARFKSWMGGQGLVQNIEWKNIRVFNVTFPIFVTQSYFNQGSNQTQVGNGATTGRPNNSSVLMENFTWADFTGTINTYRPGDGSCVSDPCWYDVGLPDLEHTEAIIIECNTEQSCRNFVTKDIQLIPQSMTAPTTICMNATAAANPELGFECRNGTFIPQ